MAKARLNSPEPLVRMVSTECSASLKHPTPDLQPIRNLSHGNIEKLEVTAQRMKLDTDLEQENRRITLETEASGSRIFSLRPSHRFEHDTVPVHPLRTSTNGSYAKSTTDVMYNAGSKGNSLHPFDSPPTEPVRPDSISQNFQDAGRVASFKSWENSQLDGVKQYNKNEENSQANKHTVQILDNSGSSVLLAHPSRSSMISNRDRVIGDRENEADAECMNMDNKGYCCPKEDKDVKDVHDSSVNDEEGWTPSNSSSIVSNEDENLFFGFDGNHHSHADKSDTASAYFSYPDHDIVNQASALENFKMPIENNTNYPARIPKLLNLPKRLSQIPLSTLESDRRSKVLQYVTPKTRNSHTRSASGNGHCETSSLNGASGEMIEDKLDAVHIPSVERLPPQLRASAFFEQGARPPEFQAEGKTAVERLNNMLEASTCVPANAFTNDVSSNSNNANVSGRNITGVHHEKSSHSAKITQTANHKARRSFLFFRRKSTVLAKNHDENLCMEELSDRDDASSGASGTSTDKESHLETDDNVVLSSKGKESDIEPEENSGFEGAPSTLLAELQIRKQRLQKRTRTAPTTPYNGMHTTLLQLDAVAQIEKKRRIGQRTKLAWEEPDIGASNAEDDEDDEDVPLGVLFASKTEFGSDLGRGVSDWNRPLGLIQSRDLEDNEPLSARRNRLQINNLRKSVPQVLKQFPLKQAPGIQYSSASESDDLENETLAQRMQRLRRERDSAAAFEGENERKTDKGNNDDWSSNLKLEKAKGASLSPFASSEIRISENEGETLGQRRKRLQAKTLAGSRNPSHYGDFDLRRREPTLSLKKTRSMVDLLQNHHIASFRRVSNDEFKASLLPGSLLQQNEMRQAQHSFFISEQNRRSSYGNDKLLPLSQTSRTPSPSIPMQRRHSGDIHKASAFARNPSSSIFTGNNNVVESIAELEKVRSTTKLNINNFESNRDFLTQQETGGNARVANCGSIRPYQTQQVHIPVTQAGNMSEPDLGVGKGTYPVANLGVATKFPTNSAAMDPVLNPKQRIIISQWRQSIT